MECVGNRGGLLSEGKKDSSYSSWGCGEDGLCLPLQEMFALTEYDRELLRAWQWTQRPGKCCGCSIDEPAHSSHLPWSSWPPLNICKTSRLKRIRPPARNAISHPAWPFGPFCPTNSAHLLGYIDFSLILGKDNSLGSQLSHICQTLCFKTLLHIHLYWQ